MVQVEQLSKYLREYLDKIVWFILKFSAFSSAKTINPTEVN